MRIISRSRNEIHQKDKMSITDIIQTIFSVLAVILMWSNRELLCRLVVSSSLAARRVCLSAMETMKLSIYQYTNIQVRNAENASTQENDRLFVPSWNVHTMDLERQLTEGTLEWEESLRLNRSASREVSESL